MRASTSRNIVAAQQRLQSATDQAQTLIENMHDANWREDLSQNHIFSVLHNIQKEAHTPYREQLWDARSDVAYSAVLFEAIIQHVQHAEDTGRIVHIPAIRVENVQVSLQYTMPGIGRFDVQNIGENFAEPTTVLMLWLVQYDRLAETLLYLTQVFESMQEKFHHVKAYPVLQAFRLHYLISLQKTLDALKEYEQLPWEWSNSLYVSMFVEQFYHAERLQQLLQDTAIVEENMRVDESREYA